MTPIKFGPAIDPVRVFRLCVLARSERAMAKHAAARLRHEDAIMHRFRALKHEREVQFAASLIIHSRALETARASA